MIRPVPDVDVWRAASLVEAWGYPRHITPYEVSCAAWYEDEAGIAWIAPMGSGVCSLHAAARPTWMQPAITAPRLWKLEVCAELLGYRAVRVMLVDPKHPIRRLLRRFGYAEDEAGCVRELDLDGGVSMNERSALQWNGQIRAEIAQLSNTLSVLEADDEKPADAALELVELIVALGERARTVIAKARPPTAKGRGKRAEVGDG